VVAAAAFLSEDPEDPDDFSDGPDDFSADPDDEEPEDSPEDAGVDDAPLSLDDDSEERSLAAAVDEEDLVERLSFL